MDVGVIVVRLIHVVGGVFWAGTMLFFAHFLEPSIREAGPDGARVMQGLARRRFVTVMPVVAILTILTGIDLLRRASANFQSEWFRSPTGATLALGGAIAIIAFVFGLMYVRPAAMRLMKIMQAGPPADAAQQQEVAILRGRMTTGGKAVAGMLALSVVAMAIARYLV